MNYFIIVDYGKFLKHFLVGRLMSRSRLLTPGYHGTRSFFPSMKHCNKSQNGHQRCSSISLVVKPEPGQTTVCLSTYFWTATNSAAAYGHVVEKQFKQ